MFYISSEKIESNIKLYGVTDTSDNVEEFYSYNQLFDIIKKYSLSVQLESPEL